MKRLWKFKSLNEYLQPHKTSLWFVLTLCVLMDSSIWFNTMNLENELGMVHFTYQGVKGKNCQIKSFFSSWNRPPEKSVYQKLIFLFLNQKICCGYSKEPSHWDGSFEHPKQMLKLIDKKIFTILRWNFVPIWTYAEDHFSKQHWPCWYAAFYIFCSISSSSSLFV